MKFTTMLVVALLTVALVLAACKVDDPNDPCDQIDSDAARDNCYDERFECSKISSQTIQDSCVSRLSVELGDIEGCTLIQDESAQGNCLYQFSEQDNDATVCENINNEYWADICNANYARRNDEGEFCSFVRGEATRRDCYYDVAVSSADIDLCAFAALDKKDRCIISVAEQTQDLFACNGIASSINQNVCRVAVAVASGDASICEEVPGLMRENCLAEVEGSLEAEA